METMLLKKEKLIREFDKLNSKTQDAFLELIEITGNEKTLKSPISFEEYNKQLAEAEQEIDTGNYYTQEEATQLIQSWKKRLSQ